MDSELTRFIRQEIARQLNAILSGQAGKNDQFSETISNLFPGMPDIPSRPVMHPYGLSSRAPQGTLSVIGRMGEHTGNRMVLGHRDKNRPSLSEGEAILYNEFGQRVYLKNGKILIGSKSSSEPFVLGNIFKTMMDNLLTAILNHTHQSNVPSAPTGTPLNSPDFQAIKTSPIDDSAILSDEIFGEKVNGT